MWLRARVREQLGDVRPEAVGDAEDGPQARALVAPVLEPGDQLGVLAHPFPVEDEGLLLDRGQLLQSFLPRLTELAAKAKAEDEAQDACVLDKAPVADGNERRDLEEKADGEVEWMNGHGRLVCS